LKHELLPSGGQKFTILDKDDVVLFFMSLEASKIVFWQLDTHLSQNCLDFGSDKGIDAIGGFGEGLKLAALVLAQCEIPYTLTYVMKGETWVFEVEASSGALEVDITETDNECNDLIITIDATGTFVLLPLFLTCRVLRGFVLQGVLTATTWWCSRISFFSENRRVNSSITTALRSYPTSPVVCTLKVSL
jgi:hypothetical protein